MDELWNDSYKELQFFDNFEKKSNTAFFWRQTISQSYMMRAMVCINTPFAPESCHQGWKIQFFDRGRNQGSRTRLFDWTETQSSWTAVVAMNNPAEIKQAFQFDGKAYAQPLAPKGYRVCKASSESLYTREQQIMPKYIVLLAAMLLCVSANMTMIQYNSISSASWTLKPPMSQLLCGQASFKPSELY